MQGEILKKIRGVTRMSYKYDRATINVRKNTKQRVRNIAEDVSFEEIINYLLDVYESREQDVPTIYEYLEMDVL